MSQFISLQEGVTMIATYKEMREKILAGGLPVDILPLSETFERSNLESLFSQPGVEKLRVYFGMTAESQISVLLVGVNSNNEDILPEGDELILDRAERCPTFCPPGSKLNP